jgi:sarcosine oxidase
MAERCDFVVIGLGVMGSAALADLSRHGSVIGLEAVAPGHRGGSSHGESRIFRLSNFESQAYTALAADALATWRAMERHDGELYLRTGILEAGLPESPIIAGRVHDTTLERLGEAEVRQRFPIFDLPAGYRTTYQHEAGILRADVAVARFLEIVGERQPGAIRMTGAASVRQSGGGVEVVTLSGERIVAGAAVIATGPWIAELVPELAGRVAVSLQTVGWFAPDPGAPAGAERMPVFAIDTGGEVGLLYGFPDFAGLGVKAASHLPGPRWNPAGPRPGAAAQRATLAPVRAAVRALLPRAATLRAATTCLYTNTHDEEFIVDRRPGSPNIVFASACSGHGFKFAPAIGAMLSDLARNPGATTRFPIA